MTEFDDERHRLTLIAVRIPGSRAGADDVLPEGWLRLDHADDIDDLPDWLTTVVTRLCLYHLRKQRTRSAVRAEPPAETAPTDLEAGALLAEKIGDAMQVVVGTRAPVDRAPFVPLDVVDYPLTGTLWLHRPLAELVHLHLEAALSPLLPVLGVPARQSNL